MTPNGGYPIVLTADRTLMSEYGGGIFLGFSACVPDKLVPHAVYFSLFCPPIRVNRDGSVNVAPCGTRKTESALLHQGFKREDIVVAHPHYLRKVVGPNTKVVGITENDPLGIGPATSTFTQIFGGEAYMKVKFKELLADPTIHRYRPKIVVGGPGAWQLTDPAVRKDLGIDCVVVGESEKVVAALFKQAVRGESIPSMVVGEVTPIDEVEKLSGGTVNGVVEIARGCGRGCEFCVPTLQRFRSLPIEHIVHDVDVNIANGRQPVLHAEDVLRYGARTIDVNKDVLLRMMRAVRERPGVEKVAMSHFALASVASCPEAVEEISIILDASEKNWMSGQTGIETASPALMTRYMKGKCKPFEPEDWSETVVNAFQILKDNLWVPCGTLIFGLPGETDEDVEMTIDLLDRLNEFRSLVVPLFFVATAELKDGVQSFNASRMSHAHTELFLKCWEHDFKWAPSLIKDWVGGSVGNRLARPFLNLLLSFGIHEGKELIDICRLRYNGDAGLMIRSARSGELDMKSITVHSLYDMIKDSA
jgi:radical SAM superfamily enzyme YgiQ (UPF0313 family)